MAKKQGTSNRRRSAPKVSQNQLAKLAKGNGDADILPPPENQSAHGSGPIETDSGQSLSVVGIGASAGGLEACTQVLAHLPVDTGMTFVLVQHLDPRHESMLSTLLGRRSKIPVVEIVDGVEMGPDRMYVIPPNASVTIDDGHLRLKPRAAGAGVRTPIDGFFQSLARTYGSAGIGIVLSGTGSDGALGLQAIKAAGGITFAQDEASATFAGMPHSAVASGAVDFVGTAKEIADHLTRIARGLKTDPAKSGAGTRLANDFAPIFATLHRRTGVDFSGYKHTTVHRRVLRRMLIHRLNSLPDYARHLGDNPEEADELFNDLLIGVTSFFRDPAMFDVLERAVIPELLLKRGQDESLRVWVPGCSGGEEAYSLGICLDEAVRRGNASVAIQIFASDLSDAAIARARAGWYPATIENDVSPERLRQFFVREKDGYRIAKSLRDRCVFARQNLITDPPFSRLDLISCRNLLIYLDTAVQKRVLPLLHYALRPSGFLVLGSAETLGEAVKLFTPIDKKHRIFRNTDKPAPITTDFTGAPGVRPAGESPKRRIPTRTSEPNVQLRADEILLARYAPSGVVVNERMEVVQFRGLGAGYIEPAAGAATLDLFKLARRDLIPGLRAALQQARQTGRKSHVDGIRFKAGDQSRVVRIEAIPFTMEGTSSPFYIVLFNDSEHPEPRPEPDDEQPASSRAEVGEERLRLENELAETRNYLEGLIEDKEAASEELRAANEEVQSANEELQSTNEELETAKEEIQSTNEELTTVNDELRIRNTELGQISNDLLNVLISTNVPMLIVGTDLRIRRFTPAIDRVMKVIATDVGRPLSDIRLMVDVPDLEQMIAHAIDSLASSERQVRNDQGVWFDVRVRPYKTLDHRIDGAVVSFMDVDALKRHEQRVQTARAYAEAIVETVAESLIVLDASLRVRSANRAFYQTFRVDRKETEGISLFDLGSGQWNIPALRSALEEVVNSGQSFQDLEVSEAFPGIGRRSMLLNGRRINNDEGEDQLILLAIEDVTERKAAHDTQEFLSEARRSLISLPDAAAVVARLATLVVPSLADWCMVNLVGEGGQVEQIAVAHRDRALMEDVRAAAEESVAVVSNPLYEVLGGAKAIVIEELTGADLERLSHTEPGRARLSALAPKSMLVLPILNDSRPVGAVSLFSSVSGRRYTPADFYLADSLGRWTGLAIENASLLSKTRDALATAERANSSKAEFLAAMSHELRTPLNAIMGYVQLLQMQLHGPITDSQADDLRRIVKSQHHLGELISQILNFARIEAGQLDFKMQDFRALDVVADAAQLIEPQMQVRGLTFVHTECASELMVRADPGKVQQVLLNLLSNAMKFTPRGGTVTLSCADREGAIAFSVRDTGSGIPSDKMRVIFEPFIQLDTGLTRRTEGVGLGLTISKQLAEGMGGDLIAESTLGEGTTFTLIVGSAGAELHVTSDVA